MNWHVIESTNSNRVDPEFTDNGYDIGRSNFPIFIGYNIPKETKNTTIEIDFNTQTTNNFRIGLVLDKGDSLGWYTAYYNASNDNASVGNHTLKFVSDSNGVWKTYLDNNRTSNDDFTLNNDRNIGFVDYTANSVKITDIRIYETN